jgi:hypothetical protein
MNDRSLLKDAIKNDVDDFIVTQFAEAAKLNDISSIEGLLDESGTFEIRLPDRENISVNKSEYLLYLGELINKEPVTDYAYDRCLYCSAGHRVVLFNGGRFPFNKLTIHDRREKTGFRLGVIGGKVHEIKFCFSFIQHDNRPQFEVTADKIKSLMRTTGCSFETAYSKVFE